MANTKNEERDAEIIKLRDGDHPMTYQEIADKYGISRQRVHQIFIDYDAVQSGLFAKNIVYRETTKQYFLEHTGQEIDLHDLAKRLNASCDTARIYARELGWTKPEHHGMYRYGLGCRCAVCKKAASDHMLKVHRDRRAKGLCYHCNKKALKGKTMCKLHLERIRNYNRAYMAKKRN